MKIIFWNLKTAALLLPVLFFGEMQAEEILPARAGVCFRFDDNQPPAQWREMGALFESYGYRMCLSLISQNLNAPESRSTLRELAKKGHLMLDHLPSHAVYQIFGTKSGGVPAIRRSADHGSRGSGKKNGLFQV